MPLLTETARRLSAGRGARCRAGARTLAALLLAAAWPATARAEAVPGERAKPACVLDQRDLRWIERAFAAWGEIRRDRLQLPPAAPPPMLLFDRRCAYRLEPAASAAVAPVPGRARLAFDGTTLHAVPTVHGGTVRLLDGRTIAPAAVAFTSIDQRDSVAFVVMALGELWRRDPDAQPAGGTSWEAFLPRALVHELVHTRQLAGVARTLRPLQQYLAVPVLDDDVVQHRFGGERDFRLAVERERGLLLEAAMAPSRAAGRRAAARALEQLRSRRARYFTDGSAPFAELEDAFLDMEGVAQWAAFCVARSQAPPSTTLARLLDEFGTVEGWWSQDEGFALYLALDALVPGWQRRTGPVGTTSAVALLHEALAGDERASAAR